MNQISDINDNDNENTNSININIKEIEDDYKASVEDDNNKIIEDLLNKLEKSTYSSSSLITNKDLSSLEIEKDNNYETAKLNINNLFGNLLSF